MRLNFWVKRDPEDKQRAKWSPDLQKLQMDFFCQLTYMAVIAISCISRGGLFHHAARLPYISARYFQRINFVARALNHDYAEACRIVGESTKEPEVKALLLRLSGTLSSGEDVVSFLEREAEVASEVYGNQYERSIEVLKKWSDAYVALIMSSAIVTVMAVVTMIIGSVTVPFILGLGTLTIVVTISGVYLMYSAAPRETTTHSLPFRSPEQTVARWLTRTALPLGLVLVMVSFITKGSIAVSMLVASAFLFPVGLLTIVDDIKIGGRDRAFAGFVRSLGAVSQATNVTTNEAMGRLDSRSMGTLKRDAGLLHARLQAGIEPRLCWERFVAETGSEQINRGVRIFLDGTSLGAAPEMVGNKVGIFALKISLLRAKRKLVDSGFLWLAGVMHIVLVFLVVFVHQTLSSFASLVQKIMPQGDLSEMGPGAPSFGMYASDSVQMKMLFFMVMVVVVVLTGANAIAMYACSGGHMGKLAFYLAITTAMSGGTMLVVPSMVNIMFGVFS